MTLLKKKGWMKIFFLAIACFFIIYFIIYKINFLPDEKKLKTFEKTDTFFKVLKKYDGFYPKTASIISKNSRSNTNKSIRSIFSNIDRILFINKAILVDPNIFTTLVKDIYNKDQIKNFYNKKNLENEFMMAYVIEIQHLANFFQDLSQLELPCNLITAFYKNEDLKIPASVYIKCEKFYHQIAIMYPRGDFFWLPKDELKLENVSKHFGDSNRALNKFKTVAIENESRLLSVPLDIGYFLYQYKHSQFIECNHELAESTYKLQRQNDLKNAFFVSRFGYVKNILETNRKIYWLMAGTLLGWYRECGVIPHTHDSDISLYSDQFDLNLQNTLVGDKLLPLTIKFGLDNDSLELRIGKEGIFHMDIFFTYGLNQTHQWFPYHVGRQVKRTIIKKFSGICSADLLGEKFFVPCNPEKVLNDIYGEHGWQKLDKKFSASPNIKKWKKWSSHEWLNAIKFYHEGKFLKDSTLNYIKRGLTNNEKLSVKDLLM